MKCYIVTLATQTGKNKTVNINAQTNSEMQAKINNQYPQHKVKTFTCR